MIVTRGFPQAVITRGFGLIGIPSEVLTCIEQILTHVDAVLTNYAWASISPKNVYRGIRFFDGGVDAVPFMAIVPRKAEATRPVYGVESSSMLVDISTVVRLTDDNPSEVGEAILGEMISAVFSNVPAGAHGFDYLGGGVDGYPDFTGDLMTVGMTLAIAWDYAQERPGTCLTD